MQFTSFGFLAFAAALLLIYYLIPKKGQWMLLLGASCLFYLWAGTEYLVFILITVLTTYAATNIIGRRLQQQDAYIAKHKAELSREDRKTYKAKVKRGNRIWLIGCLVVNFSVLALCKGLLIQPFRAMAQDTGLDFLTLGLPLGISFYMFQSMGYVIDVYRGTVRPERNIFRLALFVSYFPQLIQGPISKFSLLAPQLCAPHSFDGKEVSFGLQRMLWGYFKKLVVADRIAVAVAALKGSEFTGFGFLLLSVFYAVQIYADFTGGIDITIGLSQALGIRLPENFIRPYFSKNIAEYWRRWHITLGEWMKDYIFYPISVSQPMLKLSKSARKRFGNFGKRLPVYVASVATWFVTGIWHGLTPNFILWGMLNCFFIVLSEECAPLYTKFHGKFHLKDKAWYGSFEILRMFMLMNLIRVVDLFPDVGEYWHRVGSLFTTWNISLLWDGSMMKLGLTGLDYAILGSALVLIFSVSLVQEKKGSLRALLQTKPDALRWALLFVLFVAVVLMGSYGIGYNASNFIYNQF
ncbi:MAG: MBOAT family protein [Oscillospiraceae bacterium]|nr:MBOAT family protein [Oscillospiraceae bacterium]